MDPQHLWDHDQEVRLPTISLKRTETELNLGRDSLGLATLTARRELLLLDRLDRPLVQAILPDFGHQQHCSIVLRLAGLFGVVGLETNEQARAGAAIADEK